MSTAIDYLNERGLSARVAGDRLIVSPAKRITPEVRKYIKANRLELIAEVAANDGLARSRHWIVLLPDQTPFTMIGPPVTRAEALRHAQGIWPDATVE